MNTTDSKYDLMHRVTFTGDYFTMTTCVFAHDEEHAVKVASQMLRETYGWSPEDFSNDIEAEREEQ
jgi:hypothetical protein